MSKSKRRLGYFDRRTRFESLEQRIVMDTQIGTVTMPYTGKLSAVIYDANGQYVRTLFHGEDKSAGTVTLTWDGRDDLGRLVPQDGNYTWKAAASQATAVEQGWGSGDSQFNGQLIGPGNSLNEASDSVDSLAVNRMSATLGEVGGTFARNVGESTFGDTTLSQTYTLGNTI